MFAPGFPIAMRPLPLSALTLALALVLPLQTAGAAEPEPEIRRAPATPQADGVLHTLRVIPEACVRLQGRFSADAATPYALEAVPSRGNCAPRAQLVAAREARPERGEGWVLNDVIRVPRASCPGQQAVLRIWRHPGAVAAPRLDAQGRSRVYLDRDGGRIKDDGQRRQVPAFATDFKLEGKRC
ncbi:hypothetical protein [Luteimonas sp. e5]